MYFGHRGRNGCTIRKTHNPEVGLREKIIKYINVTKKNFRQRSRLSYVDCSTHLFLLVLPLGVTPLNTHTYHRYLVEYVDIFISV